MKKLFLGVFMLFDLALIGGAGFVLFGYITHKVPLLPIPALSKGGGLTPVAAPAASAPGDAPAATPAASGAKAIGGGLLSAPAPAANESSVRKIAFAYHNSKARKVFIRADFTGWKAQPMIKGANGSWTYQAPLTPGEYAYCFTADDKTFKDPANKRTKVIGRTTVSAILVEALPAKAAK